MSFGITMATFQQHLAIVWRRQRAVAVVDELRLLATIVEGVEGGGQTRKAETWCVGGQLQGAHSRRWWLHGEKGLPVDVRQGGARLAQADAWIAHKAVAKTTALRLGVQSVAVAVAVADSRVRVHVSRIAGRAQVSRNRVVLTVHGTDRPGQSKQHQTRHGFDDDNEC